jgi:hypothetical protein
VAFTWIFDRIYWKICLTLPDYRPNSLGVHTCNEQADFDEDTFVWSFHLIQTLFLHRFWYFWSLSVYLRHCLAWLADAPSFNLKPFCCLPTRKFGFAGFGEAPAFVPLKGLLSFFIDLCGLYSLESSQN